MSRIQRAHWLARQAVAVGTGLLAGLYAAAPRGPWGTVLEPTVLLTAIATAAALVVMLAAEEAAEELR